MPILLAIAVALLNPDPSSTAWPSLHRRAIYGSAAGGAGAPQKQETIMVPQDAIGFYRFRDATQGVAIVSHSGEVSGYLLKVGQGKSDKGLILGYVFNDVAGTQNQISFTTKQVHGVWYGFQGQIVPKSGRIQPDRGAYRLEGTLTMHDELLQMTRRDAVKMPFDGKP
jgi:hypothetical protein